MFSTVAKLNYQSIRTLANLPQLHMFQYHYRTRAAESKPNTLYDMGVATLSVRLQFGRASNHNSLNGLQSVDGDTCARKDNSDQLIIYFIIVLVLLVNDCPGREDRTVDGRYGFVISKPSTELIASCSTISKHLVRISSKYKANRTPELEWGYNTKESLSSYYIYCNYILPISISIPIPVPASMSTKPLAIIAGVGTGTGLSIARRFARGYNVIVLSRSSASIDPVISAVEASGGTAYGISTDVSSEASVTEAFNAIKAKYPGSPTAAAVFNAGSFGRAPFLETALEDWERILAIQGCVKSRRNCTFFCFCQNANTGPYNAL